MSLLPLWNSSSLEQADPLTSVGQQGFVQELCRLPEMLGDVHLREVINLHTQVLDLQASIEFRPSVDTGAMSSIQDMGNSQPLQPPLVHSHTPEGKEAGMIFFFFFLQSQNQEGASPLRLGACLSWVRRPHLGECHLFCFLICLGLTTNIAMKRDSDLTLARERRDRELGTGGQEKEENKSDI